MVGIEGRTLVSGQETTYFGIWQNATEAQAQFSVGEAMTFSGLKGRISSGNSGTATIRSRVNAANGNMVCSVAGLGDMVDTTNSDVMPGGALANIAYTDTGTDAVVDYFAAHVEYAVGHGCIHGTSNQS